MPDQHRVVLFLLALYHVRVVTAQTSSFTKCSERYLVALLSPFFVEFLVMANRPYRFLLSFLCASDISSLWCFVCLPFRAIMLIAYSSLSKHLLDRELMLRYLHVGHGEAEIGNKCLI